MKSTMTGVLCLIGLLCSACGGGDSSDPPPSVSPPPPIGNRPPALGLPLGDMNVVALHPVDRDFSVGGVFVDFDGDRLTYELRWGGLIFPSGFVFDGPRISGATPDVGLFNLVIKVSDGHGGALERGIWFRVAPNSPPAVTVPNALQVISAGTFVDHDVTQGGRTFADPDGDALTYDVSLSVLPHGLSVSGVRVSGVFDAVGAVRIIVKASDEFGASSTDIFVIAVPGPEPGRPDLPEISYTYDDFKLPLPHWFRISRESVIPLWDTTPAHNPTSDAGATLGRALFYDKRLSVTNTHSCGSCHHQEQGFASPTRFSVGITGESTPRNAMGLTNVRYSLRDSFFSDMRAHTLESLALMPIQEELELGNTLPRLVSKLAATDFYPPLFEAAFGTREIDSDRIARALAQFLRALISYSSRFDLYDNAEIGESPDPTTIFTPPELLGMEIFRTAQCHFCHSHTAKLNFDPANNGLDEVFTDPGIGDGMFRTASLRNVARTAPYMHDGRFATLREVVDHYDHGVKSSPHLPTLLLDAQGEPRRLNLTEEEKDGLIAFLEVLTDEQFLTDPRFSDPFQ